MSICLYKQGSTHTVRGIDCEMVKCDAIELDYYLNKGYVADVQKLYDEPLKREEPVIEQTKDPEPPSKTAPVNQNVKPKKNGKKGK